MSAAGKAGEARPANGVIWTFEEKMSNNNGPSNGNTHLNNDEVFEEQTALTQGLDNYRTDIRFSNEGTSWTIVIQSAGWDVVHHIGFRFLLRSNHF